MSDLAKSRLQLALEMLKQHSLTAMDLLSLCVIGLPLVQAPLSICKGLLERQHAVAQQNVTSVTVLLHWSTHMATFAGLSIELLLTKIGWRVRPSVVAPSVVAAVLRLNRTSKLRRPSASTTSSGSVTRGPTTREST